MTVAPHLKKILTTYTELFIKQDIYSQIFTTCIFYRNIVTGTSEWCFEAEYEWRMTKCFMGVMKPFLLFTSHLKKEACSTHPKILQYHPYCFTGMSPCLVWQCTILLEDKTLHKASLGIEEYNQAQIMTKLNSKV